MCGDSRSLSTNLSGCVFCRALLCADVRQSKGEKLKALQGDEGVKNVSIDK